jgi:hypothetical protein
MGRRRSHPAVEPAEYHACQQAYDVVTTVEQSTLTLTNVHLGDPRSLFVVEESNDGFDGCRRLLFHQPMARVCDDGGGDIDRHKTQLSAMAAPKDFSAPIARTGIVSLPSAASALLSIASCVKAAN